MIILNEKNNIFIGAVYRDKDGNEWSVTSIFEQYVNLRNMNRNLIWFEHRFRKITLDDLLSGQYELTDKLDINYVPFRIGDIILLEDDIYGFPSLTNGKKIYICDYVSCSDTPMYVCEIDEFGNPLAPCYNIPLNAIQEIVDHPLMKFKNYPMYFNKVTNKWEYSDSPSLDDGHYLG